jgi:Pvc16 N-terminal domain
MSNSLAIATVTGVLRSRIQALIDAARLSGLDVVAAPPQDDSKPGVYLHLYQVLPNGELRNQHLPEHDSGGALTRPPRLAVDLHYLLSFVGSPSTHDPERLAGLVLTGLNEGPALSRDEIADFAAALPPGHVLAASDLSDQVERVRLTLLPLDVEELSRLWGMYGQARHRLSVAYRASVVMLDAQVRAGAALPVTRAPEVTVVHLRAPQITEVRSAERAQAVVRFGERIVVRGSALRGDETRVTVGATSLRPPAASLADAEISLDFDAASGLGAGVAAVRVVHRIALRDGTTRDGPASNVLPFALVPAVSTADPPTETTAEGALRVRLVVEPPPAAGQAVMLHLTGTSGEGSSTWTEWTASDGVVSFLTSGLAAGRYLLRVETGGALSLLDADGTSGALVSPSVTVS